MKRGEGGDRSFYELNDLTITSLQNTVDVGRAVE